MAAIDRRSILRFAGAGALAAATAPILAACGGRKDDSSGGGSGGQDKKTLKIGYINWDEDIAVSNMWKKALADKSYTATLTQLDAAPLYAGLAKGDVDLFFDSWLPTTHADYWKQYGPQLEDLGSWYDKATLAIAVPKYVDDVNSLADLKGKGGKFEGKIYGIEPGAGEMRLAKTKVLPAYGLNGEYTVVDSSTPAMLAQLKKDIEAKKPIAVTLWHPHWAYTKFPIKDLKDPQGAWGSGEKIHTIVNKNFQKSYPKLHGWLKNFKMSDSQLGTLEDTVLNKYGTGKEEQGVEEWQKKNADFMKKLTS